MDPRQFLIILRARYKAAIVAFALCIVAALLAHEYLPKQYSAETSVMVDIRSADPVAGVLLPPILMPGNMSTQLEIIQSELVARKVVKALKLDQDPATKELWLNATAGRGKLEDWVAQGLLRNLKAAPSRDSNIINISFHGADPGFTADVANAFAQAYIDASIELKVEPARQYAKWFGEQSRILRDQVEKAQDRLTEFQQQKGIVASVESMDNELAKLNDLSARLTAVQAETRDAQSRQQRSRGGAAEGEVLQDSVVMGLRTNIAQLEAKLMEAAVNLGTKHPQYQRMESEIAELKNRLVLESRHVTGAYSFASAVGKSKEGELKAALEAQRKKLLATKKERDEIAVLMRDVETAKRAYEAVTNRFNQTNLESQATRSNIAVLAVAVAPLEPSFPKPLGKTLLMAIALGIVLAGACVVGLEMVDSRIRTADDLAEMLQLPVLAVIARAGRAAKLPYQRRTAALPLR